MPSREVDGLPYQEQIFTNTPARNAYFYSSAGAADHRDNLPDEFIWSCCEQEEEQPIIRLTAHRDIERTIPSAQKRNVTE